MKVIRLDRNASMFDVALVDAQMSGGVAATASLEAAFNCFGSVGSMGTLGSACGTAGTFGSAGSFGCGSI